VNEVVVVLREEEKKLQMRWGSEEEEHDFSLNEAEVEATYVVLRRLQEEEDGLVLAEAWSDESESVD